MTAMRDQDWMYFGCRSSGGAGHYLSSPRGDAPRQWDRLNTFDGKLAPQPERELYLAALSRLGGWNLSALSWWDRSVDRRGQSNSIIFAPSLDIAPDTMLAEAQRIFPWVFARLPQQVRLQHEDGKQ